MTEAIDREKLKFWGTDESEANLVVHQRNFLKFIIWKELYFSYSKQKEKKK